MINIPTICRIVSCTLLESYERQNDFFLLILILFPEDEMIFFIIFKISQEKFEPGPGSNLGTPDLGLG